MQPGAGGGRHAVGRHREVVVGPVGAGLDVVLVHVAVGADEVHVLAVVRAPVAVQRRARGRRHPVREGGQVVVQPREAGMGVQLVDVAVLADEVHVLAGVAAEIPVHGAAGRRQHRRRRVDGAVDADELHVGHRKVGDRLEVGRDVAVAVAAAELEDADGLPRSRSGREAVQRRHLLRRERRGVEAAGGLAHHRARERPVVQAEHVLDHVRQLAGQAHRALDAAVPGAAEPIGVEPYAEGALHLRHGAGQADAAPRAVPFHNLKAVACRKGGDAVEVVIRGAVAGGELLARQVAALGRARVEDGQGRRARPAAHAHRHRQRRVRLGRTEPDRAGVRRPCAVPDHGSGDRFLTVRVV